MGSKPWQVRDVLDDFYILEDGSKRLRVTRVLGAIQKEGLAPWAARMAAQEAWDMRGEAGEWEEKEYVAHVKAAADRYAKKTADLGTLVHSYCETVINDWLTGKPYPEVESFPREVQGHMRGFLRFCNDPRYSVSWLAAEYRVMNSLVMGTVDAAAVVDMGDGPKVTICDIKTGKSVWASAAMQLSVYRNLPTAIIDHQDGLGPQVMDNMEYEQGIILHVRPRSMNLYPAKCDESMFTVYRHALEVYRYLLTEEENALGNRISV